MPWGIVFVFLNDYLSQEKGFSVPDATFMVMLFGVGCAIGGICGGYIGQVLQSRYNRSYLPLFMADTTVLGILPFLGLLNSNFPNHHGYKAMIYSILGGCFASLTSVNVRPIIINVNPPETRGAALTAANLLITLGRGIGPSCITLMGSLLQVSRQAAFNMTLTGFWTIAAIQLLLLAKTLPKDQDLMEAELARYAAMAATHSKDEEPQEEDDDYDDGIETALMNHVATPPHPSSSVVIDDGESLVSIEDYMTSFDGVAARRSIQFMRQGIRELKDEVSYYRGHPSGSGGVKEESSLDDDDTNSSQNNNGEKELSREEIEKRRQIWIRQQQ
jgi:sugar phosphate permease